MRISVILAGVGLLIAVTVVPASTIDTTTHGNWIGVYGSDGYILNAYNGGGNGNFLGAATPASDMFSLPSYISSYTYGSGAKQYVWATGESAVTKDLQDPSNPSGNRNAATAFNDSSWSIDLNLNKPQQFQLSIYALDWDSFNGRHILIHVGADTAEIGPGSDYQNGAWAKFNVTAPAGPLTVTIEELAAANSNATISGLAFDPVPEPTSVVLFGLGAVGLLAVTRRRCRKS